MLESGDSVNSIADLEGKTIATAGQGSVPEYVLEYILEANGLEPGVDVTIDFKSEYAEVATLLASGGVDIAMLPEPFVTSATVSNSDLGVALNMNDEWDAACQLTGNEGSQLCMGPWWSATNIWKPTPAPSASCCRNIRIP